MRLEFGSIFSKVGDAWIVYTSAYCDEHGVVLDGDVSNAIGRKHNNLRHRIQKHIKDEGLEAFLLTGHPDCNPYWDLGDADIHLVAFPTKPGVVYMPEVGIEGLEPIYRNTDQKRLPGFMSRPNLLIVRHSVSEFLKLLNRSYWKDIYFPPSSEEVNDYLMKQLDDRCVLLQ